MPTKVRIPSPLRQHTDGADIVEVQANTVGEALAALTARSTGIAPRLFKVQPADGVEGQLNRFVNIYVNDEDIRFLDNLETKVTDTDEISIVPAIAGG